MAEVKPLKMAIDGVREIATTDTFPPATVLYAKAWRGQLYGLALSNNGTDANNDIDVAVGNAWDAGTDALLELTSGITKRLDASWAVGTNQGGLDTGAKANSTWYHVWLIRRSDTGVVDVLFSTSASSPTMPSNYDQKRRIGSVVTNGSGAIRPFVQDGDQFSMADVQILGGTTPPTSPTLLTVISPAGIRCKARVFFIPISSSGDKRLFISGADTSDMIEVADGSSVPAQGLLTEVMTNTSSQISYYGDSATNVQVFAGSRGWYDRRGRDG